MNMMDKQLLKDSLGWGLALWLIGYVLGIVLIFMLPASMIGWVIMPVGVIITFWVLFKKVKANGFQYYLILAVIWTMIAVFFDYLFIVKTFNSPGTFISPLIVARWKKILSTSN